LDASSRGPASVAQTASVPCVAIARKDDIATHFASRFNQRQSQPMATDQLRTALTKRGLARQVLIYANGPYRTTNEKEAQALALQSKCATVFQYKESIEDLSTVNALSILYVTIVGFFIVPGNSFQLKVSWDAQWIKADTGHVLYKGKWQGVSSLYHFRPASFPVISSRAYQEALDRMLESELPKAAST
jgi:hypothetical protein